MNKTSQSTKHLMLLVTICLCAPVFSLPTGTSAMVTAERLRALESTYESYADEHVFRVSDDQRFRSFPTVWLGASLSIRPYDAGLRLTLTRWATDDIAWEQTDVRFVVDGRPYTLVLEGSGFWGTATWDSVADEDNDMPLAFWRALASADTVTLHVGDVQKPVPDATVEQLSLLHEVFLGIESKQYTGRELGLSFRDVPVLGDGPYTLRQIISAIEPAIEASELKDSLVTADAVRTFLESEQLSFRDAIATPEALHPQTRRIFAQLLTRDGIASFGQAPRQAVAAIYAATVVQLPPCIGRDRWGPDDVLVNFALTDWLTSRDQRIFDIGWGWPEWAKDVVLTQPCVTEREHAFGIGLIPSYGEFVLERMLTDWEKLRYLQLVDDAIEVHYNSGEPQVATYVAELQTSAGLSPVLIEATEPWIPFINVNLVPNRDVALRAADSAGLIDRYR